MSAKNRKKIVILGTGGTIAGRAASPGDDVGYMAAQVGVQDLVAAVPGLQGVALHTEQVAQLDSKDMEFSVWQSLAGRVAHHLEDPEVQGIVITHGTDTLEETAYFLHRVVRAHKPVVLTCAMRPATSASPDGPQNLMDAVVVASEPGAQGVLAVCAGVLHHALYVQKTHTYHLDAFGSGDAGPLGQIEAGSVRLTANWPVVGAPSSLVATDVIANEFAWPWVEVVVSHAGARGDLVRALVAQGVQGLVVAGTGNGTVHTQLQAALLEAQAAGVRVLRATRCASGVVISRADDVLPHAAGLSPVKARVALLLDLLQARAGLAA